MASPLGLDATSSIASVVVFGDSISEGYGATSVHRRWQQVLQDGLRSRLQPAGAAGAAVPYISASPRLSPIPADYPRTATAGVTQSGHGLGLRSAVIPAGDSVTFTFTGTRAKLYGTKSSSVGKYGIRLDGAAEVVVDGFAASSTSGVLLWDSGALTAGPHTVLVQRSTTTTASPGNLFLEGLVTYNGDEAAGLRVVDASRSGASLATFTASTAWHSALTAVEGAQLLIMPWGANDATSGATPDAFRTGLESLIAAARSTGFAGTVLLPKMPKRGSVAPQLWSDYLDRLDAIAAADPNVVTIDLRARIPDQGTPEAIALGLYVDEAHFSDAGQALVAAALTAAILSAGWGDPTYDLEVQAAFGADVMADPGTWTWTDLSSRLTAESIRLRAGKSAGADHVSPSTCSVALDNDDGALTPKHPMSPYWPNVERGTPLRVRIRWGGVWYDRFSGFADQWEPTFLPTTTRGEAHSLARVTASGLLRRLEQGARPARSAPARYIPTTGPVAYWPLEEGRLVSEGAALVGGQPMRPFTGTHPSGAVVTFVEWGRGELAPWLPQAVSRSGNHGLAIIWAPVSMPATGRWVVDFMYRSGTDAGDSAVDINPSYLGGALGWPQLLMEPEFRDVGVAVNGEPEVFGTAPTLFDGEPHHVRWDVYQNGAKVSWNVYVDAQQVNAGTTTGNMTLPVVSWIALTAGAQGGADMAQGHVAVYTIPPPVEDAFAAAMGHQGETAAARVARLCAEEGVAVTVGSGDSERLGPQPVAGLMDLLREAEDADMGLLYELGYGLGYRPRGGRYNAPVAMTVDLAEYKVTGRGAGDVLKPAYDDQGLRNEWTVERRDGLSATAVDAGHQVRSGPYTDSVELNIASDDPLADHASWRVHLGTVEELREQTFPLDLAANPELVAGWLSCGVGSRIVRTNPPVQYGPGPLDRLVEGWTDTIDPRSWLAQATPAPASPWQVATVGGPQPIPAAGSTLAAALSTGSPEPINDNPYLAVDLSGWSGLNATIMRSTSTVPPVDGAVASIRIQASAAGSGSANANTGKPVSAALPYYADLWAWSASALAVAPAVDWLDAGGAYLSTSFVPPVTLTPGVWRNITGVLTPPVGAAFARMRARHDVTTPAGAVWHAWAPRLGQHVTMSVISTPENGPWTEDPADMPLDVRVGGEQVTASLIGPAFLETFGRTLGADWGTSESGQVWATSAGCSVSGGLGRHSLTAVNSFRTSTLDIGVASFELSLDLSLSIGAGASAPVTLWVCGRLADLSNYYTARMIVGTAPGTVALQLFKRVGGVLTPLAAAVTDGVNAAGNFWRLTFTRRASALSASLRNVSTGVPEVSTSASDSELTTGTGIGLLSRLEAGNTNTLPVTVSWDNITVANPQRVTLSARGVNGVLRAWAHGTEVDVWQPAVAAL